MRRSGRIRRRRAIIALSLAADGDRVASRPASTSSPARSTKRTPPRSTPRCFRASRARTTPTAHAGDSRRPRASSAKDREAPGGCRRAGTGTFNSAPVTHRPALGQSFASPTHDRQAGVRPVRPPRGRALRLLVDQSRFPVAAEHQQHPGFHRRARADRAGDDAADDLGRIRPLGRLGLRLLPCADVDALQRRASCRWRSPS